MTPCSMLLHLFLCWLTRIRQFLEYLDFFFDLLLDVYLFTVADVFQSGAYKAVILTVPDRGVRFTIVVGSYR
jgi:hypothetical protein